MSNYEKANDAIELILSGIVGVLFFAVLVVSVFDFLINQLSKWEEDKNKMTACTYCFCDGCEHNDEVDYEYNK